MRNENQIKCFIKQFLRFEGRCRGETTTIKRDLHFVWYRFCVCLSGIFYKIHRAFIKDISKRGKAANGHFIFILKFLMDQFKEDQSIDIH